jgi:hypothetical protein
MKKRQKDSVTSFSFSFLSPPLGTSSTYSVARICCALGPTVAKIALSRGQKFQKFQNQANDKPRGSSAACLSPMRIPSVALAYQQPEGFVRLLHTGRRLAEVEKFQCSSDPFGTSLDDKNRLLSMTVSFTFSHSVYLSPFISPGSNLPRQAVPVLPVLLIMRRDLPDYQTAIGVQPLYGCLLQP